MEWIESRFRYFMRGCPPWVNERHYSAGAVTWVAEELGWGGDGTGVRRLHRYRNGLKNSSGRICAPPADVLAWISKVEREGETLDTLREHKTHLLKQDVPTEFFERAPVEDALHTAGVSFAAIYPEIAAEEDLELQPDRWCWHCQEAVTPIKDECPWNPEHRLMPWAVNAA